MVVKNNILLITDNEDIANDITNKLVLLRNSDGISISNIENLKKTLLNSTFSIVIFHAIEDIDFNIKTINTIKTIKPDAEILLLLEQEDPRLILKAYDAGIFDYFTTKSEEYNILIKTINCYKYQTLKDISARNEKLLYLEGIIDNKTNLYSYKYIKNSFNEIIDNPKFQNGIFAILTLDESTRTKISTNRLASIIKSSVRSQDIVISGKNGQFYIVIPNIDINNTENIILKIQEKMGEEFKIRAGVAQIGLKSFETLNKMAQDSLTKAILNEQIMVCLDQYNNINNDWLNNDDNNIEKKDFKLFNSIFTNKLNNIITPIFYRYQKDFETKLTNTQVSQYSNTIESVFSLKNEFARSELTIRHNGYAKFKIEIIHTGLDSAENTKYEIPLKDLTDKLVTSLLKKLKDEYKDSAYTKGNENA